MLLTFGSPAFNGRAMIPSFSVAPMMDWTDRHCRFFHRLLAPRARLYTEMVTAPAVLHGCRERILGFDVAEHPVALQLGGSDPSALAQAARIGAEEGYDEINLNCGCPSDRVQNGSFGACLMAMPDRVAECAAAMITAVPKTVPITIKCRIGIDDADARDMLFTFVETVAASGVTIFIIHARKAWLKGLSPRDNRTIPPLDYDLVYALKAAFPGLSIHINGGIRTVADIRAHLAQCDGVMIGRAAYEQPDCLAEFSSALHGTTPLAPLDLLGRMAAYIDRCARDHGTPVKSVTRHMLGLFAGTRGAKQWRRIISQEGATATRGSFVIDAYERAFGDF